MSTHLMVFLPLDLAISELRFANDLRKSSAALVIMMADSLETMGISGSFLIA